MAKKTSRAKREPRIDTIGVLTSGGDAPGMNATVRAVVRSARVRGLRVYGVRRGFRGLLDDDLRPMDERSVGNIIQRGGSILGSSRAREFETKAGRARALRTVESQGIGGLVLIGGDGTLRGGRALTEDGGPPIVGIPATIDNDVACTDRTIGFDTAVNTAIDALDKIRDTADTIELLHFVEVMGRGSGWLAMLTGIGAGAEAVILPEKATDVPALCTRIRESLAAGKRSIIVIVAEGGYKGGATTLGRVVGRRIGLDYRVNILGHIQRGGSPSAADRVLGSQLGAEAVTALLSGSANVMVGRIHDKIIRTPITEVLRKKRRIDPSLSQLLELIA